MGSLSVRAFVSYDRNILSPALLAKEAELEALHTGADIYFTGYTNETPDTTTICTTPDAVRAAIETWRTNPAQLLKVVCQWNGILDLTNDTLLGPTNAVLTADAGEFGGWVRPAGGVWMVADSGYSPVFGDRQINVYGFPRFHIDGIGFAGQAGGGDGGTYYNLRLQTNSTYPLLGIYVFKNCTFGLTIHRPAEAVTEYVKTIGADAHTVHIEDCVFAGTREVSAGQMKFQRVLNNHVYNLASDFVDNYTITNSTLASGYVNSWVEGNVCHDVADDAALAGLHSDFYQFGSYSDTHSGNNVLIRYNVWYAETVAASGTASQGLYGSDSSNTTQNIVAHDNLFVYSAYWGLTAYSPNGDGVFYFERNTLARTGDWYLRTNGVFQDPTSRAQVSSQTTVTSLRNNVFSTIIDNGYPYTEAGNYYVTPLAGRSGGDGNTAANGLRYEEFFHGTGTTFIRDGSDILTYSLQAGDTDKATAFYRFTDCFKPLGGWGLAGCSNPETWTYAPARP